MSFPSINYFFNLKTFDHQSLFKNVAYPWDALKKLDDYVLDYLLKQKNKKDIFLGEGSQVDKTARIKGPVIIGKNTTIGFGALLRGPLIIGDNCLIGRSEIKHSVLLNQIFAKHFNYIGDSLIGNKVNFGAGSKLANLRFDWQNIKINYQGKIIETNLQKLGSIIGDESQMCCNSVLNPGTILGKKSLVYPLTNVKPGFYKTASVIKNDK
jgi:NDP-sugar pyrophosphorylase family protein